MIHFRKCFSRSKIDYVIGLFELIGDILFIFDCSKLHHNFTYQRVHITHTFVQFDMRITKN